MGTERVFDLLVLFVFQVIADPRDETSPLLDSFAPDTPAVQLWKDCCEAARSCCDSIATPASATSDTGGKQKL